MTNRNDDMTKLVTNNAKLMHYASAFGLFEKNLNGESSSSFHKVRQSALEHFLNHGFPTPKDEDWRFTNIAPIVGEQFALVLGADDRIVSKSEIEKLTFCGTQCVRLVFVDGHYSEYHSSMQGIPKGVTVENLAVALQLPTNLLTEHLARYTQYNESAFSALNTAFTREGAFVSVPNGVHCEVPIHLLFVSTGRPAPFMTHPRNLIVAGKGSKVSVVESYIGLESNTYFTNAVTEVVLDENAVVEHEKFQWESSRAFHIGTMSVHQLRSSVFTSNAINFGGVLVRNNVNSRLDAEGCECTLNGLSLGTGEQLIDNHTIIDHAKPNCSSHELYKSILDGTSRGVFNGKIFVRKDAQKTDAKQTNKTLLLSPEATIDSKPQLEIFADDVKCTHGATIGQLDENQVFYLRTRGLGEEAARDLLTFAFASDIIGRVTIEPLRDKLDQMLQKRLRDGRTQMIAT